MKAVAIATALLLMFVPLAFAQRYPAAGLVLKVDRPGRAIVVSCEAIPGYMDAMVMKFSVPNSNELEGVDPGTTVDFTLVVGKDASHAEGIRVRPFESLAQEPLQARRLKLLEGASGGRGPTLAVGDKVPDFSLTDQTRRRVALSQFAGKVVAINFMYTRCVLPDFCYRMTNNLAQVRKRFSTRMGRDLVLLTITFDPAHDGPDALAEYSRTWKADPNGWRFLTGSESDVGKVCRMFGVGYWQDEALLTHALHTVVVDRSGKLVANLEGNQFTAKQLGDLVETVLGQ